MVIPDEVARGFGPFYHLADLPSSAPPASGYRAELSPSAVSTTLGAGLAGVLLGQHNM